MKKTAILLGSSGLTGSHLLKQLLLDDRYEWIKVFNRTSLGIQHPKLREYVVDLLNLDQFRTDFTGQEVFCCIGTTAKQTPDMHLYHKIDFGIPVSAARLCRDNNIDTFLVVSAMGANEKSRIFYSRTKGEMEQAVLSEKIPNTYLLRPSIIGGNRKVTRAGEKIGVLFAKCIQPMMVGSLRKYRLIEAEKIAKTMIWLANSKPDNYLINSDQIEHLANN